jgi:hypothetical protein
MRRLVGLCSILVMAAVACDHKDAKKDEPVTLAASASALAPSTPTPTAKSVKFAIDRQGKTAIGITAPEEEIKAATDASSGNLDVDLHDLAQTRGEIKIDLKTLSTHTFHDDRDSSQTNHARTWLEVNDVSPAETREKYRWVVFAIRSIDALSASDASKVAATPAKDGGDDVRTVTLTAHGDFLLHGREVKGKMCTLEVKFHYPAGAAPDSTPTGIDIHSKTPLRVQLAEHDVKPRDSVGKLAQEAFKLLGTKVGETADVTVDLHATPSAG